MGPSRRMQKQGPPPSLEQLNSAIKRKAGEQKKPNGSSTKRRKPDQGTTLHTKKFDRKLSRRSITKRGKDPSRSDSITQVLINDGGLDDERDPDNGSLGASLSSDVDSAVEDHDMVLEEEGNDSTADSDAEPRQPARFSDEGDDSDAEEKLTAANIEGLSRKLDEQEAKTNQQAQDELEDAAMQTNIMGAGEGQDGEDAAMQGIAPDLQLLRTRITDTIRILGDFSKLADRSKSRSDYKSRLLSDICTYYGYTPYLAEKLLSLFTPLEAFAFFEANESPRPVVLRTNTIRTNRRTLAQTLINRGVVLEPVGKWSKVGLQVFESAVPLGATPEYLAGHYIIQAASSFLPVMALAPQPNERILDMAAAPGGKTTYISALMRNTGIVFANDANRERAKGLVGNIHRLGCKNTVVSNLDSKDAFPKVLGGFDRVLLDAPCSGTGVIGKDASVKTSKTERDFLALPHMQKQLLVAAIDSTNHASKTGGYIVYSTCSVTVEENEGVVQYALRKRPNVRIVETGLGTFGSEGFKKYMNKRFDDRMNQTRRYFPHRENVDGFFVCKLQKMGPTGSSDRPVSAPGLGSSSAKKSKYEPSTSTSSRVLMNGAEETSLVTTTMTSGEGGDEGDDFGGFESEEDQIYMANAVKKQLRRKGLNPKIESAAAAHRRPSISNSNK